MAAVVLGLALGVGGRVASVAAQSSEDEEALKREAYVPHPEFHPFPDQEQLAVEAVTLIRVRRSEQSEALVAREESGWEHVVLEGYRLTFYNQPRQPLRRGSGRHVIVQDWSGGAHCCFDYYVLHVQGVQVRREGLIRGGDCSLRVADLDQDGNLELIACDARFAYAFDLPFADSPLIPLVYAFRDKGYLADNRRYPQVFRFRIAQERRRLAEAQQSGDSRGARRAVISLLLHMLYAGRVTEAWCTFERSYRWADRAAVRQEVLDGLKKAPDPDDPRVPPVDLSYALATPGRCT
ncbi:MAG TPA: hypothetical protein VGW35_21280 [Methylomirabilota bacterium]|nr:hypothetical protein [Methylomirabilota bacterium]